MCPSHQFYVPPGGPPQNISPDPQIYRVMGESLIFKMLEDFYLELEKSSIRHLFPENMAEASKRSAAFFVSILGGPPLFEELYGPPMMRKRHMAFPIDEAARQVWLDCFKTILKDADTKYHFPVEHMDGFLHFLDRFSSWMVNKK
jgi:hemoglobin